MPATLNVLFVCQHGAAKSVIAARHLEKLARARGVTLNAAAAGLEPDDVIPPHVIAGLRGDGLDEKTITPRPMTRALFENAEIVVSFGCDLSAVAEDPDRIVQWNDVPAVSDGYDAARTDIVRRLQAILDDAEARSGTT